MDAKDFEDAVLDAAVNYVRGNGHGGSYDALGQRDIYIAAAGSNKWTSLEDAIKAVIAGRRWAAENDNGE